MQPVYTIYDLSDTTGFSKHQIQRFIKKGMVPKATPIYHGDRSTRYTSEHLKVLIQIRDILDNNMTMADIYDRLHPYTGEDDDD